MVFYFLMKHDGKGSDGRGCALLGVGIYVSLTFKLFLSGRKSIWLCSAPDFALFQRLNLTPPLFLCLQDLSCIDDLSTNSLFSSPADSLSEYADTQSFISTDNLDTVPTLWDVNTSTTTPAQSLEVSSKHPHTTHTSLPETLITTPTAHLATIM